MATSDLDICNMALDYCSVRNITSIEEDTKAAEKCKMWYDTVRKSLLLNLNASFSIKRAQLAKISDYVPIYGYNNAYQLPKDLLQVLNLASPLDDNFYQIEGNLFYCNEDIKNVCIRYLADIQDVTEFDSEFCDLFALKLAEKICLPLTEDDGRVNYIRQLAAQKYIECSTKYGRDNRIIVINKPGFRQAKINPGIQNYNYPMR